MNYFALINHEWTGPHAIEALLELEAQGLIDAVTVLKPENSEDLVYWRDAREHAQPSAAAPAGTPIQLPPRRVYATPAIPTSPGSRVLPSAAANAPWNTAQAIAHRERLRTATGYPGLRLVLDVIFWLTVIGAAFLAALQVNASPNALTVTAALVFAGMAIAMQAVFLYLAQAVLDIADAHLLRTRA